MQSKGQNLVIFSLFRHDAEIESTSFMLAKELSVHHRVLYFDNPYTVSDLIKLGRTEAFRKKRGRFGVRSDQPIRCPGYALEIFPLPIVASIHFLPEGKLYRALLKMNEALIRKKIGYVLNKKGITDFVFINSFNFHYPEVASRLKPRLTVYHCLDPVMGPFDGKHGRVSERQLVKQSDLVICSSRQLYDEKRELNRQTYFIPNAADLDHSSQALDAKLPVSALLGSIPSPVVGYLGSIDHRMDFALLEYLAGAHPAKQFVLVGPVHARLPDSLAKAPNVHLPGKVPYSEMPAILKGFDVCLIPFAKNEQSATVFPLKLFEYLGAGKPVVISDFNPDLKEFTENAVWICDHPEAFSSAIQRALDSDTHELRERRRQVAGRNTWKQRAEAVTDLLAQAMPGRG